MQLCDILVSGCREIDITLTDAQTAKFEKYYEFLEAKNQVMDLTSIFGIVQIANSHFLDSLCILKYIDIRNKKVIDIGTGAGFPGMPMKIVVPSSEMTLLDAQRKRVDFLSELTVLIGLKNVATIHGRAEEIAPIMRDSFDFAVSRAVTKLNTLCELCIPFLKCGGIFAAHKSVNSDEEIKNALKAIETLGAEIECVVDYRIPNTNRFNRAVIIKKTSDTPDIYPRKFAKIIKRHL